MMDHEYDCITSGKGKIA